jgi:hypothetical protein
LFDYSGLALKFPEDFFPSCFGGEVVVEISQSFADVFALHHEHLVKCEGELGRIRFENAYPLYLDYFNRALGEFMEIFEGFWVA